LPQLNEGKRVVKPLHGGSSIGVHIFENVQDLEKNIAQCFDQEDEVLIEPFCTGKEFTILVLENDQKEAVALLPTQIEFAHDTFFDYRKKYLSTTDTIYSTPAHWDPEVIQQIRVQAQKVFYAFGLRDFARLD